MKGISDFSFCAPGGARSMIMRLGMGYGQGHEKE